ncbi:MAG: hypothetical protein SWY16_27230 [Cyanobacteriota bacterium]|nr:hypothetical protein [Cyanobacteriota bacterium]
MTNQGFGTPKQPTSKEIERFKNIVRVRKDYWASWQYRDKLVQKYGAEPVESFIADDPELFLDLREIMPPQMREKLDATVQPKAEAVMFEQFVRWGFEPGKDFNIGRDDNGQKCYFYSNALVERMEAEGFPMREALKRSPAVSVTPKNPFEQLDKHLGVPFTRNLVASLTTAAASVPPEVTLCKVFYLARGLGAANPQIDWNQFLLQEIGAGLGSEWSDRLKTAFNAGVAFFESHPNATDEDWCAIPDEPQWWVEALCRALEIDPKYMESECGEEDLAINSTIARRLHQVWRGEDITFLEVTNAMDERARKND